MPSKSVAKAPPGLAIAVFLLLLALAPTSAQTPPASGGPVEASVIEDLVAANRILADQGVLDGFGHVSIRHPGNPSRFLMSRSLAPALTKPRTSSSTTSSARPSTRAAGRASSSGSSTVRSTRRDRTYGA
jgi:hemin uptake protein HemP